MATIKASCKITCNLGNYENVVVELGAEHEVRGPQCEADDFAALAEVLYLALEQRVKALAEERKPQRALPGAR